MITFAYPWMAPTVTVSLRDPDFQDKVTTDVHTKLTTMMDASIRSRRTTPATVGITLKFRELTRNKVLELQAFLIESEGAKLRYVDMSGTQWAGFVLTDPNSISTYAVGLGTGSGPHEANQIELEFEGVKLA